VKTDDLIVQLARSARPVTPLRPPVVRAAWWFAAAVGVMIGAVVAIGPRADLAAALGRPAFLGSIAVLLIALASAAPAAFMLSVPGAGRSRALHVLPVLAVAAWPAIWLVVLAEAGAPVVQRPTPFHWACAIEIVLCALATGGLLFAMVSRAAPLRPGWTAVVASLAGIAAGTAATQLICPLDDPRHQLIGHVLTAVVVLGAGLLGGRRALETWRRP